MDPADRRQHEERMHRGGVGRSPGREDCEAHVLQRRNLVRGIGGGGHEKGAGS